VVGASDWGGLSAKQAQLWSMSASLTSCLAGRGFLCLHRFLLRQVYLWRDPLRMNMEV